MTAVPDLDAALAGSRSGAVAVARPDLAALRLGGGDALRYLHIVSSQYTNGLLPGDAASALLLSPKGKIEFALRLAVLDDAVLLDTEAGAADGLAERLRRFVFRYDVTVDAVAPAMTTAPAAAGAVALSVLGPAAPEALEAAGLPPAPADPGHATLSDGLAVHRTPMGVDLVGDGAAGAAAALARAGVATAPLELVELARIERGVPRWGLELTDDVLAEEAGLLGSHVHLDKGCYPGQETVARVHNLGHVQRRLAGLRFDGGAGPSPRTDLLTEDGRRAGQLRSVADHPGLGPIGLAYVRRTVPTGSRVLAGDFAATVVELPFRSAQPNR